MTETKYLRFTEGAPKKKTQTWNVAAKDDGVLLGRVQWFARWRGYAFFPENNTVFEATCMTDLSEFITGQNQKQRANEKSARRGQPIFIDHDLTQ